MIKIKIIESDPEVEVKDIKDLTEDQLAHLIDAIKCEATKRNWGFQEIPGGIRYFQKCNSKVKYI